MEAARDLYLGKTLSVPQRAVWWQLARLGLAGLGLRLLRYARVAGEFLYAAWWWTVIALAFLLGWLAVALLDIGLQLFSMRARWFTAESRMVVLGLLVIAITIWNQRCRYVARNV